MRTATAVLKYLGIALLFSTASAVALGAPEESVLPNSGHYSPKQFPVRVTYGNHAIMRDGVNLSVDLFTPDGKGPFPTILVISPYGRETFDAGYDKRARWFAERGYVVALADTRGRYNSEGVGDPFNPKQKTDGYDLVEWLAKQSWSNGRVGMMGASYLGWEQWWTATQAPPSLKAIVPEVAPADPTRIVMYTDGVLNGYIFFWDVLMSGRTNRDGAPSPDDVIRKMEGAPYREVAERGLGAMNAPWIQKTMDNNLSTDEYWKEIAYQTPQSYSKVAVPSLNLSVWQDAVNEGGPMNYTALKHYGATPEARSPKLVIGPWLHGLPGGREIDGIDYGPDAVVDWDGHVARFFDHYLKGIDNGVEKDPPVQVFIMGANRWLAAQDWPLPQTKWTKYYLQSNGSANSLKGDGVLTLTAPAIDSVDAYTYDPAHPSKSPPLEKLGRVQDVAPLDMGNDVLVYRTPPLESAVEVAGPIEATLYASTSARDTDWMVRLEDVDPEGRCWDLADGALRARNRDPANQGRFNSEKLSTVEPGKVYQYTIEFWRNTGSLFKKGHRIQVEISSSGLPWFLPNRNTGADNAATVSLSQAVVAHQEVHHGSSYPSHILLPVIPTTSEVPQVTDAAAPH